MTTQATKSTPDNGQVVPWSSGRVLAVLLGAGVLGALVLSAVIAPQDVARPTSRSHAVAYRVTGFAGGSVAEGSIAYRNAEGGTETRTAVALPWETSFGAWPSGAASVSVQNGLDYGSVACEILVDGVIVKRSTGNGPYSIATCAAGIE